jgi:ferredoxin
MTDTSDAGTADQQDESPLEVVLDADECVSAGKCVNAAPGFFVFDADEIGSLDPTGPRPSDQVLLRIARQCPSGAIRLRRDGVDVEI